MNDSMVAMSGWIMPAPFAMPVIVTGTSPTVTRRDAPFGTVSVVMIADTAANQPSAASAARAAGSAATIFATGSGSMITPVENGSTCCSPQPSIDATAAHVVSAACDAGGAGAGVGVARVDDQRADARAALEVTATDDHRRRAEAVSREHAGRCGARLEHGEQHVVAFPVLDLRRGRAERHSGDRQQLVGRGRRVADGHRGRAGIRRARRACRGTACISCRCRRDRDRCARPSRRRARTAGPAAADRPRRWPAPRRSRHADT